MQLLGNEQYGSVSGADFAAVVVEAIRAINNGIFPERIPQGSSGSYFVKNFHSVSFFASKFIMSVAF